MPDTRLAAWAPLLVALPLAAVLAAQTYPHAFPRAGVTKLFENERVIAPSAARLAPSSWN